MGLVFSFGYTTVVWVSRGWNRGGVNKEGSCNNTNFIFISLISDPISFIPISKSVYCLSKRYIVFTHSCTNYPFIHSFIHITTSHRTIKTITTYPSTTKIMHYFTHKTYSSLTQFLYHSALPLNYSTPNTND